MLRAFVLVVVGLLVSATVADARPGEPLVLVAGDTAFASALDDALLPAGMDVVPITSASPASPGDLPVRSRELADGQHAAGTVWLLPSSAGSTLVAYDRRVDRLLIRELPYRSPLSATQAAEAARMVRTMLRALRVAQDSDAGPPHDTPVAPAVTPEPWLAASLGIGTWIEAPGDTAHLAGNLTVAWRPYGLGAAVGTQLAPSADLMTPTFTGSVRDVVVAAESRYAIEVAPAVRVTPAAGAALHVIALTGGFGGSELRSRRYDPALRVGATAAYALPRGIDVGLSVSADCLLRRQEYAAGTDEILVVPRLQIMTGVFVGLRL